MHGFYENMFGAIAFSPNNHCEQVLSLFIDYSLKHNNITSRISSYCFPAGSDKS